MDGQVDYRKVTDALAGALDRLHEKQAKVTKAQTALSEAQAELKSAQDAAMTVQTQLDAHLREVLPVANAAQR